MRIGISFEALKTVVATPQWYPHWPLFPWLLGVAGLGLAYARHRRRSLSEEQQHRLTRQLRQLALLTGTLLLLRLGSLLSPLSALFPYLTLLWSPHATWTLAAVYLLYPQAPLLPAWSTRAMALALLLVSVAGLALWSLYFCQMTMLHGDEAHYLRVSQSLLHDGDMDLSNNLGTEQAGEFHIIDFPPHQAPGSPPGKIHSVHPIGLSALLLPAYWAGLELWSNPRLPCSLLISLMSAGALTLAFLWLVRLGFDRWQALGCVLMGATTTPFFLYTAQLYPEIPALLITWCCLLLLAHWQRPEPQYESLGRREPLLLAGLLVLLVCLLFLHPRYLPLALFLGAGIALQVKNSPQRRQLVRLLLPLGGVGGLALVAYNYAYSRDLFGPFLPGNAWEDGALQGSTWLLSLPGHWLHATTGLLNSSPLYAASILGLAWCALKRDLRVWGALAFYLATAGVNGLHPDWTFGFCPPARYLLTALPLLLWGLALFLREFGGRLLPLFALLFALALAYDSVFTTVAMPEQAFGGSHLLVRSLSEFYPLDIHFFTQSSGALPWSDLCFWALLIGGLIAGMLPVLERRWRLAGLLVAGLLPCAWGQGGTLGERLDISSSPYFSQLNPANQFPTGVQYYNHLVDREYQMTTGHTIKSGGYSAQAPGDPAGILHSYYAPLIQPGIITYSLSGVYAEHAPGQVAGHLAIAQRQVLPAIADWGIFHHHPITSADTQAAAVEITFQTTRTSLAYAAVEFAGAGALAFKEVQNRFVPVHLGTRLTELRRFTVDGAQADNSSVGFRCEGLERGYYLARYHLKGSAFGSFFERKPVPVYLAVQVAQLSPPGGPSLEAQAKRWLNEYFPLQDRTPRPDFVRPLVENLQAPWWTALPLTGDSVYQLEFGLPSAQEVWLLFKYPGDAGLQLEGITLYRAELQHAALGN